MAFNPRINVNTDVRSRPAAKPELRPEAQPDVRSNMERMAEDAGVSGEEYGWAPPSYDQVGPRRPNIREATQRAVGPKSWQERPVGQAFEGARQAYERASMQDAIERAMWPQHRLQKTGFLPVQEAGSPEKKYEDAYIEMLDENSDFANPADRYDPVTGEDLQPPNTGQYQIPLIQEAILRALEGPSYGRAQATRDRRMLEQTDYRYSPFNPDGSRK